jgi:septation ring formation regulator EzrA
MRPQEINRNVSLAFKRFTLDNNLSHFQKCKNHLEKRLERFRKTYPELHEEGAYYLNMLEDMDAVKSKMEYISDRWNCPGRIKFMLEVIKRG